MVTTERKIEGLELPYRSEWLEDDLDEHHRLTVLLTEKEGSVTDISDESVGCPTVTARTRKHKGLMVTYSADVRNRGIRYDFVYKNLSVPALCEKWGLSQRQIYTVLGDSKVANNLKARHRIDSRRA